LLHPKERENAEHKGISDFNQFNLFIFVVKGNVEARKDIHSAQKKGSGVIFSEEASNRKFISGDSNGNVANVYI